MFSKNCAEKALKKFINKQFQENFMKFFGTLQFGKFPRNFKQKVLKKL
jgi:hypothetical protein